MTEPTSLFQPESSTDTLVERRAAVRYACDLDSRCRRFASGERDFWAGQILNISTCGMGLLVCRKFEVGTLLGITVETTNPVAIHTYMARVANVRAESPNSWIIGCAFTTRLSEEELESLL